MDDAAHKLILNDDGSVTIPLRGREDLTLEEPSMADLAWLSTAAAEVDTGLPELPSVTDPTDPAQADAVALFNKVANERTQVIYGETLPYGHLLIEAIKRVTASSGEEVAVDATQLYGWAASPLVVRTLLERWRNPLPGPASLPAT